jgi:hypothetical protein
LHFSRVFQDFTEVVFDGGGDEGGDFGVDLI